MVNDATYICCGYKFTFYASTTCLACLCASAFRVSGNMRKRGLGRLVGSNKQIERIPDKYKKDRLLTRQTSKHKPMKESTDTMNSSFTHLTVCENHTILTIPKMNTTSCSPLKCTDHRRTLHSIHIILITYKMLRLAKWCDRFTRQRKMQKCYTWGN